MGKPLPPPEFAAACRALEDDAFDVAQRLAEDLIGRHPEAAEGAILLRLIRRRVLAPAEPWLDALLQCWQDAGRPLTLGWKAAESLDESLERFLEPALVSEDPRAAMKAAFDREFSSAPLMRLIATNWGPEGGDPLACAAMAAVPTATEPDEKLWLLALLESKLTSPPVALEATRLSFHGGEFA